MVVDLKSPSIGFLSLYYLFWDHAFYLYKLTFFVKICENSNLIFAIFEVMLPSFEKFYNDQKFPIMNLILILN